ncbi:MAG: DUF485 domain-containing protein [Proteobacteria bacterium]|nr:MAG: DUF485 domain-containing protein [Pseudomonadota bacterium]
MTDPDAALERLAAARGRVAALLTGAVVALYFGFVLLIAFAKPWLATKLAPGLSVGIALGALVIVLSWLATFVYVRWANRHYDAALERLRKP